MQILSSTNLLEKLHHQLKLRSAKLIDAGVEPHLAVVLVGEDEQSVTYVDIKSRRAKEDGIILSLYHLTAETPFEEIKEVLTFLAQDNNVHGIVLQLPLPGHITEAQVNELLASIPVAKDVDGLLGAWEQDMPTEGTIANLRTRTEAFPPIILSVLSLLEEYDLPVEGKSIVVVGRGRLVGMPLEGFFTKLGISIQTVDESTDNIIAIAKQADILITGTGQPNLVTYQWVKEGAVVLDCSGDVHHDSVEQVAAAISPPKGGIGPLTVVWLLHNVLQAAEHKHE